MEKFNNQNKKSFKNSNKTNLGVINSNLKSPHKTPKLKKIHLISPLINFGNENFNNIYNDNNENDSINNQNSNICEENNTKRVNNNNIFNNNSKLDKNVEENKKNSNEYLEKIDNEKIIDIDFYLSEKIILDNNFDNINQPDSSNDSSGSFNKKIYSNNLKEIKNKDSYASENKEQSEEKKNISPKKKLTAYNIISTNKIINIKDSKKNEEENNIKFNIKEIRSAKKKIFSKDKSNQINLKKNGFSSKKIKNKKPNKENSNLKIVTNFNIEDIDKFYYANSEEYNFDLKFIDKNKKIINYFLNPLINSTSVNNILNSPINSPIKSFNIFTEEKESNITNNNINNKKTFYIKSIFKNRPETLFVMNRENTIFKNPYYSTYIKNLETFHNFFIDKSIIDTKDIINVKAYKDAPRCIIVPVEHSGCKFNKNLKKCNLIWKLYKFDKMVNLIKTLTPNQKYNHFPKTFQLGRKDNLWKNFKKFKRKYPNDYNYHPQAYIIPEEFNEFKLFAKANPSFVWIMKPLASSRGRGIRLLTSFEDIPKECLICRYIEKPHLINNKKYDLRIYILITSFTPLKIFLFKDGLVRFASEEYTRGNKENIYVHLTNYAINKKNTNYDKTDDDGSGSKWTLNAYERFFIENNLHDKFKFIWEKTKDIIIKTLISAAEESANYSKVYSKHDNILFELYGFDIIVDSEFNPWLLEVNVNPSLNCDSELDYNVKTNLITDVINIIGLKPFEDKNFEDFNKINFANKNEKNNNNVNNLNKKSYNNLNNLNSNNNIQNSNSNNHNNAILPVIKNNNFNFYSNIGNQNISISQVRIENKRNFMSEEPDYAFNFTEDIVKFYYQSFLKNYEDEYFRSKFTNFDCIFPMAYNAKNYIKFFKSFDDESIVLWKWILSKKPIDKFD